MVRNRDLQQILSDKHSAAGDSGVVEEPTMPQIGLVDRAAVRHPGQLCTTLEEYSQTNRPTFVIATSKEVAASVDRVAKQPFNALTEEGIKPYRRPAGLLKTAGDKLVVQRSGMRYPTVELPAEGGVKLTWDGTTVSFSSASAIAEHAADLPDGVFLCSENQETWDIESPDDGHVETVDSADSFKNSYSAHRRRASP